MDSTGNTSSGKPHEAEGSQAVALRAVAEALAGLRYGAIELTVHDGRVVQLAVTERRRFS